MNGTTLRILQISTRERLIDSRVNEYSSINAIEIISLRKRVGFSGRDDNARSPKAITGCSPNARASGHDSVADPRGISLELAAVINPLPPRTHDRWQRELPQPDND
jgi:hypothetical protein